MTQTDLANKTGLSKNAVSQLCRNPSRIGLDTIDLLCGALDLTPAELFDYSPENKDLRSH
jgi:DNA-binding Xre family transcriptional regulator